jgi:predicted solute-binding protein
VKKKLSIVSYLNSFPLAWGFLHGPQREVFISEFCVPARCADRLASGEAAVGLIPAIECQRIQGLKIVPGLSIASRQEVESVLLLSRQPAAQLTRVAVDTSSRTSVALLAILCREKFGCHPQFVPIQPDLDRMLDCCPAALLIGDAALRCRKDGLIAYDLGAEWSAMTGKPFVYALWASRVEMSAREIESFHGSLRFGQDNLEQIVSSQAAQLGLKAALIETYLKKRICYSLDAETLEGLQLFYSLASRHGLIADCRPLVFWEW